MGINDQLTGGGKAGTSTTENYALDKPYDLFGRPSVETVSQIDEMLTLLFRSATKNREQITTINNALATPAAAASSAVSEVTYTIQPAQAATIASVPVTILAPPGTGLIWIPIIWSMTKTVTAIGAINTILSLEYDDAAWSGFTSMQTFNADTNIARPGQYIGMPSVSLTNTLVSIRTAVNKGLRVAGTADPGNYPATQITFKITVLYHSIESL